MMTLCIHLSLSASDVTPPPPPSASAAKHHQLPGSAQSLTICGSQALSHHKTTKLAPLRQFLLGLGRPRNPHFHPHPHPRHNQSLLRYLFPRAGRDHYRARYRERLLAFHLDTLPRLKLRAQSRIYRFILERQRRREQQTRVVDYIRRHGRRVLLGPKRRAKDGKGPTRRKMTTPGAYPGYDYDVGPREPGARRRKLAAMAGSLYRTGQQAVTDFRDSYAQTRGGGDPGEVTHIPGAFPHADIVVKGNEHMIIFPTYAKRHVKRDWSKVPPPQAQGQTGGVSDEDYWRNEWERAEDAKAIVDVDVRGWLYSPHTGPMTRRNRVLVGLARQLSGITAPRGDAYNAGPSNGHQAREDLREQEKIASEAARIERQGQEEKRVAYQGGYSENPDSDGESVYRQSSRVGSVASGPNSPTLSARTGTATTTTAAASEFTEAELVMANSNLLARIAPFMTYPIVALPITLFFYNDTHSQSRTVLTNDAGHFHMRAPLDFIPTHVRVLASEDLSAIQPIVITEPAGISLISDIDDTIKTSNISLGAREIFRNTFVRELGDLIVEGVPQWYNEMHDAGVNIHYCSNSPWQLYPVLATFFKLGGLPPGSLHLKQYNGMLQGIFEPVAERKKTTLVRLLKDFPERRFLFVGDSGEADLEVYTELALANPGRVLAIFIRDVTTPEEPGFFDAATKPLQRQISNLSLNESKPQRARPAPPPARKTVPAGPTMGTLIDFSDETPEKPRAASATDLLAAKKPPPPRPQKPAALRSSPSTPPEETPPPMPPRKQSSHPLSQMQNSSQQTLEKPPPPPPRRRTPQSANETLRNEVPRRDIGRADNGRAESGPRRTDTGMGSNGFSSQTSPTGSPTLGAQNRKLELWKRRLATAQEQLDGVGVRLYTWRRGQDVIEEARAIVRGNK